MVTSRDVARAAGVSQATVSRVVQSSERVSRETREKVLKALQTTGYVPNTMARAMKTRRTGTIGVVVARVTNPFYPEVLEILAAELAAVERRMILWNSEGAGEQTALQAIRQGLVDGIVFTTVTAASVPLQEALSRGAPVVILNRSVDGAACGQVTSDNEAGARTVAEYFVTAGHRRIGYIGGPPGPSTQVERERGFRDGLAARGAELPDELCLYGDFSHRDGHAAMRELLCLDDPPTAVFCVNDLTAFGALDGARSLGVRVPDQVWVVGYDDIAMSSWEAFDLTTVRQPIHDMVRKGIDMLLQRIDDPAASPQHYRFPSQLVVRGSTAGTPPPKKEQDQPAGGADLREETDG